MLAEMAAVLKVTTLSLAPWYQHSSAQGAKVSTVTVHIIVVFVGETFANFANLN
jgi:hypothetical protein